MRLALKVSPRARTARILGVAAAGRGETALRIAVTAPPEDGKANEAVLVFIARMLGLPRSALAIESGAGSRVKRLRIAGAPDAIAAALDAALADG